MEPLRGNTLALAEGDSATTPWVNWPGGMGMFTAEGTFGGGTIKLQTLSGNGTALDVGAGVTFTAAGAGGFWLPPGPIRVSITTATAVFAYATWFSDTVRQQ